MQGNHSHWMYNCEYHIYIFRCIVFGLTGFLWYIRNGKWQTHFSPIFFFLGSLTRKFYIICTLTTIKIQTYSLFIQFIVPFLSNAIYYRVVCVSVYVRTSCQSVKLKLITEHTSLKIGRSLIIETNVMPQDFIRQLLCGNKRQPNMHKFNSAIISIRVCCIFSLESTPNHSRHYLFLISSCDVLNNRYWFAFQFHVVFRLW